MFLLIHTFSGIDSALYSEDLSILSRMVGTLLSVVKSTMEIATHCNQPRMMRWKSLFIVTSKLQPQCRWCDMSQKGYIFYIEFPFHFNMGGRSDKLLETIVVFVLLGFPPTNLSVLVVCNVFADEHFSPLLLHNLFYPDITIFATSSTMI